VTSTSVCASSTITAFDRFLAAAANAHLIFHVYSPLMMMEAFMMATHLEALTSTGATLGGCSGCESRHLSQATIILLQGLLNQHQVMIIQFGYFYNEVISFLSSAADSLL
jgi:hypothetical protein